MRTILVTGIGAIIGYGILRSLRATEKKLRLIGVDIYSDAVGQAWSDHFVKIVPANDPKYVDVFCDVIRRFDVDLVIPGISQDVARMSRERELLRKSGAIFALNHENLITIANDKWKTHQELQLSSGI